MKANLPKFIFLLAISTAICASEDSGHHASVKDLFWPAFNFVILFGGLIFLTRKKIEAAFTANAENIKELVSFADKKDKEAEAKLKEIQNNMENFESLKKEIKQNAKKDLNAFLQEISKETELELARIKRDTENKIESEKRMALNKLSEEVVDKVINTTKSQITSNRDYRSAAAAKILKSL